MKTIISLVLFLVVLLSCSTTNKTISSNNNINVVSDTIRIENKELEYEIIIIEPGFNAWLVSNAKQRGYYSQEYFEARNKFWTTEYNNRVMQPMQYDSYLYMQNIDYQKSLDYGYEVNYMLYNYLVYFQINYKQRLGGFVVRP